MNNSSSNPEKWQVRTVNLLEGTSSKKLTFHSYGTPWDLIPDVRMGFSKRPVATFQRCFSWLQKFRCSTQTHQNTIELSWKMMWCQKSWNFLDFLLIVFWYGLSSKLGYPRIHWFTRPCFWHFLLAINWLFTPIPGQSHLILLAIYFGDIPYISLYIIPQCIHHKT